VHHFHQILLVFHHPVDILLDGRDFIHHTFVLAAFHAGGLGFRITVVEALFRFGTAHAAAGAVGTGTRPLFSSIKTGMIRSSQYIIHFPGHEKAPDNKVIRGLSHATMPHRRTTPNAPPARRGRSVGIIALHRCHGVFLYFLNQGE